MSDRGARRGRGALASLAVRDFVAVRGCVAEPVFLGGNGY